MTWKNAKSSCIRQRRFNVAMGAITSQEWPHFISEWVFLQNSNYFYPELINFNIFPLITTSVLLPCHQHKVWENSRVHKVLREEKGLSIELSVCSTRKGTVGKSRGADPPSSEVTEEKLSMDQRGLHRVAATQEVSELSETWRKKESNAVTVAQGDAIMGLYFISSHLQISLFKEKNMLSILMYTLIKSDVSLI